MSLFLDGVRLLTPQTVGSLEEDSHCMSFAQVCIVMPLLKASGVFKRKP